MDTQLVRAFVTVAETGNLSLSARMLAVSQPALTRQLQRLEAQLGGSLFSRGRRGSELTLFGSKMLVEAKLTLAQCDHLTLYAQRLINGEQDHLRIGFGYWAIKRVMRAAAQFRVRWPEVSLALRDISSAGQLAGLNEGELDIGFMRLRPCEGLQQQHLSDDQLLLVYAGEPNTDPKVLLQRPLVLISDHAAPDFFLQVMRYYAKHKLTPNIIQMTNEFHAALSWASAGETLTLLPESMRDLLSINPNLQAITAGSEYWPLGVMWRNQPHRKALKDFISLLDWP